MSNPSRTYNDADRRQWVENDEGLYHLWLASGVGLYRWTRENRAFIDDCIDKVLHGTKPAHFLAYGG